MKSILYEGLNYKGKPSRFYAYYGVPEGRVPATGWPGVDSRFKFGITHTGCGFLHEGDSYLESSFRRRSPEKLKESLALYEASTYLLRVTFPMLWTCSPTDMHFPLACEQKSALATKGPSFLWIKVGWGHASRPKKENNWCQALYSGWSDEEY